MPSSPSSSLLPPPPKIHISCHCGLINLTVVPKSLSGKKRIFSTLCHCSSCRYGTGQLCTSYVSVEKPELALGLRGYFPAGVGAGCEESGDGGSGSNGSNSNGVELEREKEREEKREGERGTEMEERRGCIQDLVVGCEGVGLRQGWKVWFCSRCGSHAFRSRRHFEIGASVVSGGGESREAEKERGREEEEEQSVWEVATGLIGANELRELGVRFIRHENVKETLDGGLSKWLLLPSSVINDTRNLESSKIEGHQSRPDPEINNQELLQENEIQVSQQPKGVSPTTKEDALLASCHCGNVKFHITRPDEKSILPTSDFSDLIKHCAPPGCGYCENPGDEKWWLRPPLRTLSGSIQNEEDMASDGDRSGRGEKLTRYFAGTCVCESCRLSSGFEIQSWAFVPRGNIFFHVPLPLSSSSSPNPSHTQPQTQIIPYSFSNPAISPRLAGYKGREDVTREFCPTCGATVFWRGERRRELIDVSVGLLRGVEGSRAEGWLDWCGDRVSYLEEILDSERREEAGGEEEGEKEVVGREGLIRSLLDGLRMWNRVRED